MLAHRVIKSKMSCKTKSYRILSILVKFTCEKVEVEAISKTRQVGLVTRLASLLLTTELEKVQKRGRSRSTFNLGTIDISQGKASQCLVKSPGSVV